jgi:hypothetical protein
MFFTSKKCFFIRNYPLYVSKWICLKFPKGIYVYRKTTDNLTLIPKGLYVKVLKMTYNPFGIKEDKSQIEPINIYSLRE